MIAFLLHPWMLIFYAAIADCYAAYIIKMKFNELGEINFSSGLLDYGLALIKSWLFISAVVAYALAPFLAFIALNRLDLSVFYPVSIVFHLIFVILLATMLGESVSAFKITGMILIVVSLFFLFKG